MKRNSRIISATAAALLAVAPVVSTGVVSASSTVAVTPENGATAPSTTTKQELNVSLLVNNVSSIANNSQPSSLSVSLVSNYGTPKVNGKVTVYDVKDPSTTVSTLKAGHTYKVKATQVTVSGLTANGVYALSGHGDVTADNYGNINNNLSFTVESDEFTVPDASLTGTPFFTENGATVSSGSITLSKGENNVSSLVSAINKKYKVSIQGTSQGTAATASWSNLTNDVRTSLNSAGMTIDSKGDFTAPAAPFTVNVTAYATNGKTATMPITVTAYNAPTDYSNNPVITYNGVKYSHTQTINLADNASFNYVPVGTSVDATAIAKAFSAVFSGTSAVSLPVSVDASKVNTAVAGSYPVTVTAKNANGYTTTLTFNLTVGAKAPKTIQTSDGSAAPIYSFNGNAVSNTGRTVANGTQVATFKTITVNGVSYTQINSATSNEYVETKFVNGSQAEDGDIVTGPVMHESIAYDSKGNSTGVVYKDYETIKYVNKVVKINGKTYYKIAGKDQYVRVTNITGTPRRLTHNSYIYRTSTKRTTFNGRWKLYRGEKIVTYGGSYTFKNGKTYFRIGGPAKQYIRVANVR